MSDVAYVYPVSSGMPSLMGGNGGASLTVQDPSASSVLIMAVRSLRNITSTTARSGLRAEVGFGDPERHLTWARRLRLEAQTVLVQNPGVESVGRGQWGSTPDVAEGVLKLPGAGLAKALLVGAGAVHSS